MNNESIQLEKYKLMTETPVEKLVCKMAVPTIISMLVTAFYNIVDTFYVGKLNTESTGAVGIVFSFMAIIQAVGFFFGHGSGNYISRKLGEKDDEEAARMAATGFITSFLCGIVIMVLGLLFLDKLTVFLGATPGIKPYAQSYLQYILWGAPFMVSSLVLNNQLRLQGNASLAMVGIATGAILNIGLDPLFIFYYKMGIKGAALATIISQFTSFNILFFNCGRKGSLKLKFKNFSPSLYRYKMIIGGGLPSLCRQGFASMSGVLLNKAASVYGDSAVAAFSVVTKVTMFSFALLLGFGQGFQPVCGYNFGAKLYKRVIEAFMFCIKLSIVVLVTFSILGFSFAPQIIKVFRAEDPLLIEIGAKALRYQCFTLPLIGMVIMTNMLSQNIGKSFEATLLAMARQGLFFIPFVILFPMFLELKGLQIAQPVSDIFSFTISLIIGIKIVNELRRKSKQENKSLQL